CLVSRRIVRPRRLSAGLMSSSATPVASVTLTGARNPAIPPFSAYAFRGLRVLHPPPAFGPSCGSTPFHAGHTAALVNNCGPLAARPAVNGQVPLTTADA